MLPIPYQLQGTPSLSALELNLLIVSEHVSQVPATARSSHRDGWLWSMFMSQYLKLSVSADCYCNGLISYEPGPSLRSTINTSVYYPSPLFPFALLPSPPTVDIQDSPPVFGEPLSLASRVPHSVITGLHPRAVTARVSYNNALHKHPTLTFPVWSFQGLRELLGKFYLFLGDKVLTINVAIY